MSVTSGAPSFTSTSPRRSPSLFKSTSVVSPGLKKRDSKVKTKSQLEDEIFVERAERQPTPLSPSGASYSTSAFAPSFLSSAPNSPISRGYSTTNRSATFSAPIPVASSAAFRRTAALPLGGKTTTHFQGYSGTSSSAQQTWVKTLDALHQVERELERKEEQLDVRSSFLDGLRQREKIRQQQVTTLMKRVQECLSE